MIFTIKAVYRNKLCQLHKEDGPAIEYTDGHKEWYINGELHRLDGPAIEWPDGGKSYYINGKRHREDGPAIEGHNGYKSWHVNGINIGNTEQMFLLFIKMSKDG